MPYFKYKSKKVTIDGITFDSKKEGEYYLQLIQLKKEGKILDFERQVDFELIPRQTYQGKFAEHPLRYKADFVIHYPDGTTEVVDVKGYKTKEYRIKKKLMLYLKNIKIKEV